jgi:hypothetical protein
MASGHVTHTEPNTWLHPTMRPQESSCQSGAAHTSHNADQASWAVVSASR